MRSETDGSIRMRVHTRNFSRGRARVAGKRRLSWEAADAEYAAGLFMIPGTPSKLLTLHDKHFPTVCVYAKMQRLCVLILYTTSDIYTKSNHNRDF